VEEASNRAAQEVFGVNATTGRHKGRTAAKATRDFVEADDQAHSEGDSHSIFLERF